jgi:uncharacterized membrane protein
VRVRLLRLPLDNIYLTVCAPLLFALAYILPPFAAPDEAAHFYRAIQISHGEFAPVVAEKTYRQGAGGAVEQSAYRLVDRYCGIPNWSCALKVRPALSDIVSYAHGNGPDATRHVRSFSNTVVYFPIAHAVPAAAIAVARVLGLKPIGWLYAGRLANGLLAVMATWLALRLLRGRAPALLVFAIATLPMVVSVAPTLCADSSVISCSLLLMALSIRLFDSDFGRWWVWPLLILAVLFAAVAKLAYLPLAAIPAICALAAKRSWRVLSGTALVVGLAVAVTLAWSVVTYSYIYPISLHLDVDAVAQTAYIQAHPLYFLFVLLKSMIVGAPRAILLLIGWKLSSLSVLLPWSLIALSALTLALAVWRSGSDVPAAPWFRRVVLLVIMSGTCATFTFLYIQNSPVGAFRIHGYQGRYLIPLLPFCALVIPKKRAANVPIDARSQHLVAAGGILGTVSVILFLALRSWG